MQKVAVWTCTNKCNMKCKFCFGRENKLELNTNKAKKLITQMKQRDVNSFVFSGGEPLLRNDIYKLAKYARKTGMKTILHTNGILVNDGNVEKIIRNFDKVNLPIDGANEKTNFSMGRGSLKHTLRVIDLLSGRCEIVVSTVATKMNLEQVPGIGKLLKGKKNAKWRIFQFNPRLGEAKKNRKMFEIGKTEFMELAKKIKNKGVKFISINSDFEKSYWLISSNGQICK